MILESKPDANLLLYGAVIAAGALLMYLARDFRGGGNNVLCGFLLGCMLTGIGLAALAVGESRRVELDEGRRRIVLDVSRRIGGSRQVVIPFQRISGFTIGMQGKPAAGSRYFDLVVNLRDGSELYLFGGCVFDGRMSRSWIEGIRQRFEQALHAGNNAGRHDSSS